MRTNGLFPNRPLILVSKSPRRRQLLQEAGFTFSVQGLDVDESFPDNMPVEEVAEHLARRKAHAGRHLITGEEILISADSVVIREGCIYNKPEDYEEAAHMLRQLSGAQHTVITGVCLLSAERERSFSDRSEVFFEPLTEEEIDFYIRNYRPFDKAGAYGVQEWVGLCKIRRIEGSYANVMGLPVHRVYAELKFF
ncbi:MAG: Maf family nucleotide pyrophosphatase [Saprospiraceae bacterium]|nr:Maf family nucleotide pyrophosphatase [Saprospiraceae bacterium]MDW8229808.1 Maf family nucleotide pyrophosphatase [Saprospiraceae bacterium]